MLSLYFRRFPFSFDEISTMADEFSGAHLWNPYLWLCLKAILIAGWLGWLACAMGKFLLTLVTPSIGMSRLESVVFGCGLGFGCLSQLVLAVGLAGGWYPRVFWGILIGLSVLVEIFHRPIAFSMPPVDGRRPEPYPRIWLAILVLFFLVFVWPI